MTKQQEEELMILRKIICGLNADLIEANFFIKQLGVNENKNYLRDEEIDNKNFELNNLSEKLQIFTNEGIQELIDKKEEIEKLLEKYKKERRIVNARYNNNKRKYLQLLREKEKAEKQKAGKV